MEALHRLNPREREFAGLTISLTEEAYDRVKGEMFEVLQDLNAEFSDLDNPKLSIT